MPTATRQVVRRSRSKAPEQQSMLIEPSEPRRPTHHNGSMILEEELIMHLPNAPFKVSKIHLENGTIAYACRDCTHTEDNRGQVMEHRNREHGARYGKKRPKIELPVETEAPDIVLAPREDGPAPSDPLSWTIGELLALIPSISAIGNLVDEAQETADEAMAALGDHRKNQAKIDGYDELRDALTEAKQLLRQQQDYEAIKAEVVKLRSWKRKFIARFKTVGFTFSEDEEQ